MQVLLQPRDRAVQGDAAASPCAQTSFAAEPKSPETNFQGFPD